jgi:hypothetical protein
VSSIVIGFGGYKSAWAALGVTATGQPFIAFDDGVAHPLGEWLDQQYDIQLSDESLAGAFYHDGALSLVTDHYSTCSIDVPFDPNICSTTPSTQLAAHFTAVTVADGVGNEDPGRPAPFSVHLPNDSVWGYTVGTLKPIAGGFEALGSGGSEAVVNQYDSSGQTTNTIHLSAPPGRTVAVSQFSDDGLWVKGQASTATDWIDVYWDLDHPDQPLTADQLDASNRPSFSTAGASADGRVKIRQSATSTYTTVAIEVDGVAQEIHDASGAPITGAVDFLFAGIGGVATRWIAVGQYAVNGYSGPYTDYFIAFSDGTMMKLWEFLHDQWPTDGYIDPRYINVSVGSGSILFVDSTFGGGNCNGTMCTDMINFTGYEVTSIPLPDKWINSPLDVDRDSAVVAMDALAIINYLIDHGSGSSVTVLGTHSKYDIDDDGVVSAQDVLIIINSVNAAGRATVAAESLVHDGGDGEAASEDSNEDLFAAAADAYFQSIQPRRRSIGP